MTCWKVYPPGNISPLYRYVWVGKTSFSRLVGCVSSPEDISYWTWGISRLETVREKTFPFGRLLWVVDLRLILIRWLFQIFCLFSLENWGRWTQFDSYFSNGLKPPTSFPLVMIWTTSALETKCATLPFWRVVWRVSGSIFCIPQKTKTWFQK